MNRDQLVQLRNRCMVLLAAERSEGTSDQEILDALRGGSYEQKRLADFIDHDIMKGENYHLQFSNKPI